jgi:glycosyltransferase involved in cell wall biosynthesis
MLVSIIIPVYNCGDALLRTLDSLASQTFQELEIIVIDDGSTDDISNVLKDWNVKPFTLLSQANSGASVARNNGLSMARGDYIQFLDAGDVLSVNKIQSQLLALENHPKHLAVCRYKQFQNIEEINSENLVDQSGFIYSTTDVHDFLINLWGGYGQSNFIQTNCWLIPITVIKSSGFWRNYRCPDDDGEYFARVILNSQGIIYTPEAINFYHTDPGTANFLSQSKKRKYLQNTLLTIDLKYNYLMNFGAHSQLKKAIATQYLNFAIFNFPGQLILSRIAYKRYKMLSESIELPLLGGRFIELIKHLFGWRIARVLRFYLNEK